MQLNSLTTGKLQMGLLGFRVKQPRFKLKIRNIKDKCDDI